jgi:aminoglycoside 2''-phosphotransferase
MSESSTAFTLLPPFYDESPYTSSRPLLNRIRDEFGIPIKSHSWKRSAFDCDVIIVNKAIVFRFPRTEEVKKRLRHEIALLAFMKGKAKVVIPDYTYISQEGDFGGYKLIEGSILRPSGFSRLSRVHKARVISKLTGFINYIHKIPLRDFKRFRPRRKIDFLEDERRISRELRKTLFPHLSRQETEAIKRHYKNARKLLQTQQTTCALHGDLYRENVIWNRAKAQVGVIDFTDSLIGDPAKDFEVFFDYGKDAAREAYQRYQGPRDDFFMERAEMYYKTHGIYTLLSTFHGARLSFEWAREYFRGKFGLS